MIKLIASDIDGTLLPYGEPALPEELFALIRRLGRCGAAFCPASGRQYHSLRRLFAPVADEVCFLCENGAVVFGPGPEGRAPVLSKTPMPRRDALALAEDIAALPGAAALLSGQFTTYTCRWPESYVRRVLDFTGNLTKAVERLEDIPEDILKVSAFCPGGPQEAAGALGPKWGAYHMAIAGPEWLDFTLADKGTGLLGLCRALGVAPEDAAAFGDNFNDAPMLEAAGHPWLMESAAPELRRRFPSRCASVLPVLRQIAEELEAGR